MRYIIFLLAELLAVAIFINGLTILTALEGMSEEIVVIRQELALNNRQMVGINNNLANIGVYCDITSTPKKDTP
jgi:hypothetical protein